MAFYEQKIGSHHQFGADEHFAYAMDGFSPSNHVSTALDYA